MTYSCEKCGIMVTVDYGSRRFCGRKCANSRIFSAISRKKKSEAMKKWSNDNPSKIKHRMDKLQQQARLQTMVYDRDHNIMESDFETLRHGRLRRRIVLEQQHRCNKCALDKWLGEVIPLELEHKDGNSQHNERYNLEMLCPNCHAQTTTWRGRNKTLKKGKVTDSDIYEAWLLSSNIHQTLIRVGLVPKGGNYKRVYRIIEECTDPM